MKTFVTILCILLFAFACEKIEMYSEIPEVEFESFTLSNAYDTLGNPVLLAEISFWFRDGDADIYREYDTQDIRLYNSGIHYKLYSKTDTGYSIIVNEQQITNNDTSYTIYDSINTQIIFYHSNYEDIFKKQNQDKSITGTIDLKISHQQFFINKYDTIKYDIYLEDRKGNQSNHIEIEDIPMDYSEVSR